MAALTAFLYAQPTLFGELSNVKTRIKRTETPQLEHAYEQLRHFQNRSYVTLTCAVRP